MALGCFRSPCAVRKTAVQCVCALRAAGRIVRALTSQLETLVVVLPLGPVLLSERELQGDRVQDEQALSFCTKALVLVVDIPLHPVVLWLFGKRRRPAAVIRTLVPSCNQWVPSAGPGHSHRSSVDDEQQTAGYTSPLGCIPSPKQYIVGAVQGFCTEKPPPKVAVSVFFHATAHTDTHDQKMVQQV